MRLRNDVAGFLLALFALTACVNDSVVDAGKEPADENVLTFSLQGVCLDASKQAQTRSAAQIATPEENEIQTMVLLVCEYLDYWSQEEEGVCKVFEYRKDWGTETPGENVTKLELTQYGLVVTGKLDISGMSSSYLHLRAFVNGMGVKLAGSDAMLTAAEMAAASYSDQKSWAEDYGKDEWEYVWGTRNDPAAKIQTPLPMMGYTWGAHTDINNQTLTFDRQVARFDLRNGRTDLRIGSIRPMQVCNSADDNHHGEHINMEPVSFLPTDVNPGANWENVPTEVAPAFYIHSGCELTYFNVAAKVNIGGVWTDKTYKMYLRKDGVSFSARSGSRYVISVQDVTNDLITATIRIENWTEGETVDGGINGNATDSRKVPAVELQTDDDAANGLTWTLDPVSGLPQNAALDVIADGKYLQFTTPVAKAIAATRTGGDDQPEVLVDVFSASGNKKDVWLKHTSEAGTGANAGKMVHKLTVDVSTLTVPEKPSTLFVKVKNQTYPEKYVLFTVTGKTDL